MVQVCAVYSSGLLSHKRKGNHAIIVDHMFRKLPSYVSQGSAKVISCQREFKNWFDCEYKVSCHQTYAFRSTWVVLTPRSFWISILLQSMVPFGNTKYYVNKHLGRSGCVSSIEILVGSRYRSVVFGHEWATIDLWSALESGMCISVQESFCSL